MPVKFKDNSKSVTSQILSAVDKGVIEAAELVVELAAARAPKDSGELAESYKVEKNGFGKVLVGSSSDHAIAVELGLHNSPSQPHFRPALEVAKDQLPRLIREKVK